MPNNTFRVSLFNLCIIFFLLLQQPTTFARNLECPGFVFERNLQIGSNGNDVLVLQKILNLDRRTQIAVNGPGSPGKETRIFGEKTKIALQKFQALFIEYTAVADGKLNNSTRQLINNICQGPYFTEQRTDNSNIFNLNTNNQDLTPPNITLFAPFTVFKDEQFRATIISNENIQTPTLSSIIVEGAFVSNLRKLSPQSYSFLVVPDTELNLKQINLQIEADTISDLAGNKNENASNEMLIEVLDIASSSTSTIATTTIPNVSTSTATSTVSTTSTTTISTFSVDNFLNLLNNLPTTNLPDCSQRPTISIYDYQNPCYGRTNIFHPNPATRTDYFAKRNDLLPFLEGLLLTYGIRNAATLVGTGIENLLRSLGLSASNTRLIDAGGYGSIIGECKCKESKFFGQKTIGLYKIGGVPYGRYIMTPNPTTTGGPFVGKIAETVGIICGKETVNGKCVGPELDSIGSQPVIGILPTPPIFMWTR